MKRFIRTFIVIIASIAMCSCGEDRSSEFNELTKENQWIYNKMKEVYLWADSIKDIKQQTYFSEPSKFFSGLLYPSDKISFFADSVNKTTYGFDFSLMRDPLGLEPTKVYALVEYVEPASPAADAGLKRGMWISAIDTTEVNMGANSALTSGPAITLGIKTITYDDDNEQYIWEEYPIICLPAATEIKKSPLPIVNTINDISGKTGYIMCNNFDDEQSVADIHNALTKFSEEGVSNIVFDLRYNNSYSITNAAALAAVFAPSDKCNSLFCSLYKDATLTTKQDILLPQAAINVSDKQLYIITTEKTTGTANALIKALYNTRETSTFKVVGKMATGSEFATENFESPYWFKITPATAIIADANGELLSPTAPNYKLEEIGDYKHIYPFGNKQEHMLYNISYIIANGTLPADL